MVVTRILYVSVLQKKAACTLYDIQILVNITEVVQTCHFQIQTVLSNNSVTSSMKSATSLSY